MEGLALETTVADRVRRWRTTAGGGGVAAGLVAVVVCVGWAVDSDALKALLPGAVAMKLHTAFALILVGVGLVALSTTTKRGSTIAHGVGIALVAQMTLLGAEYLFRVDLGIDNLFGVDGASRIGALYPGRPAPNTVIAMWFMGVALILFAEKRINLAQWSVLPPLLIGYAGVVGYLLNVSQFYWAAAMGAMALNTALCVIVAGLALLAVRSGEGWVSLATSDSAAGLILRRSLPLFAVLPTFLGAVAYLITGRQVYNQPLQLAILISSLTWVGCIVLWRVAMRLDRVDLERADIQATNVQLRAAQQAEAEANERLRESEAFAHEIIKQAADGYAAADKNGLLIDWNPEMEALFGWSKEEVLGKDWTAPFSSIDGANGDDAINAMRDFKVFESDGLAQLKLPNRHGELVPVEIRIWTVGENDAITYHVFIREISARLKAEQELKAANRDLSEFAAYAAHDLKSPFAAILNNAELMREDALEAGDNHAVAVLSHIERSAQRGIGLIEDLLSYARTGSSHDPPVEIDLTVKAKSVADDVLEQSPREAEILIADLGTVWGWPSSVRQLLVNLLVNAIKYCPEDRKPVVKVSSHLVTGRKLVLRVSDNGAGIPQEERATLFEIFRRGSTSQGKGGSGVGLAICRKVAEQHRGRIWVTEAPGGGAEFDVLLPTHPEQLES